MKLLYWILTVMVSLSAALSGLAYLADSPQQLQVLEQLGYPSYLATLLGVWKLTGAIALLLPRFSSLKTWAYSGFFFLFSGAFLSHIASGQPITMALPSLCLLILVIGSYMLREHRYD